MLSTRSEVSNPARGPLAGEVGAGANIWGRPVGSGGWAFMRADSSKQLPDDGIQQPGMAHGAAPVVFLNGRVVYNYRATLSRARPWRYSVLPSGARRRP